MDDDTLSKHLTGLLTAVRQAHANRVENRSPVGAPDARLVALRQAVTGLVAAIAAACAEGRTVVLHGPHAVDHQHVVRTVGTVTGEVVLSYAPTALAPECSHRCILTGCVQVEVHTRPLSDVAV